MTGFHPAGTPHQPAHEHAIRESDVVRDPDGRATDVWLHPQEAQRLAAYCAGCAWQVLVDDYVDARVARCNA